MGGSGGRPRKYTERTLRKAVNAYFRGITRTITIRERVQTEEKDDHGHWIYTLEDVRNDDGEPVRVRQFVVPPTVGGLCEALGIHRSTWADYCDREKYPEFQEVTAWARETMQHYLESELLGRDGKNLKGVIFSLQNNFGMSEKKTVELGPKASLAVAAAGAEERAEILKLLEEAAKEEHGASDDLPANRGAGAADADGPGGTGAILHGTAEGDT